MTLPARCGPGIGQACRARAAGPAPGRRLTLSTLTCNLVAFPSPFSSLLLSCRSSTVSSLVATQAHAVWSILQVCAAPAAPLVEPLNPPFRCGVRRLPTVDTYTLGITDPGSQPLGEVEERHACLPCLVLANTPIYYQLAFTHILLLLPHSFHLLFTSLPSFFNCQFFFCV